MGQCPCSSPMQCHPRLVPEQQPRSSLLGPHGTSHGLECGRPGRKRQRRCIRCENPCCGLMWVDLPLFSSPCWNASPSCVLLGFPFFLQDFILGAPRAPGTAGLAAGAAFIVYGQARAAWNTLFNVYSMNVSQGFAMYGVGTLHHQPQHHHHHSTSSRLVALDSPHHPIIDMFVTPPPPLLSPCSLCLPNCLSQQAMTI